MESQEPTGAAGPLVRVHSGNPTADEAAALAVVLAAVGGASDDDGDDASALPARWADPRRLVSGAPLPPARWGGR